MKKLYVTPENKQAIEEYLLSIRGKEKERLATVEEVFKALKHAENMIRTILKKDCKDLCYRHSLNETMPRSYRYMHEADVITLKYGSKGWFLNSVKREKFFPGQKNESRYFWPFGGDELRAKEEVIKQLLYDELFNS